MTKNKKAKLIAEARELGVSEVTIEGIAYKLGHTLKQPTTAPTEKEIKDMIKNVFPEELTPEEIMYHAVPYYDELQEQKRIRLEQIKNKEDLDG